MAVQDHDHQWWSDVLRLEIRLSQKLPARSLCILPPQCARVGVQSHSQCAKDYESLHWESPRVLWPPAANHSGLFRAPTRSKLICMHCIAATFFCYVSPTIYGLTPHMMNETSCRETLTQERICERSIGCYHRERDFFIEDIPGGHAGLLYRDQVRSAPALLGSGNRLHRRSSAFGCDLIEIALSTAGNPDHGAARASFWFRTL